MITTSALQISRIFLILTFIPIGYHAQENKKIVKSNTENVKIIEDKIIITDWTLNPAIKNDIYITGKVNDNKNIKVVTDIDSLEVNLKPNQTYDFVILKNGKDSCFTSFQTPEVANFSRLKPQQKEKIKFELTEFNNIKLKSLLNKKDSVNLNFDSGAVDFYLTKTAIQKYLNPNNLPLTMNDISNNTIKIGNNEWVNQQIYPIEITSQGTEGMFGWNIFDGKIVEINYDDEVITIHSKLPKISKAYEKFKIEYMKEHFRIELEFEINAKRYKSNFLFDTGFQKAALMDYDLLTKNLINTSELKILKSSTLLNSQKKEIKLNTINVEKIIFGKYILNNIPTELNNYNKPALYETHFLGSDIIKRFNVILDFQNNFVFLKPNKHFNDVYFDKK